MIKILISMKELYFVTEAEQLFLPDILLVFTWCSGPEFKGPLPDLIRRHLFYGGTKMIYVKQTKTIQ